MLIKNSTNIAFKSNEFNQNKISNNITFDKPINVDTFQLQPKNFLSFKGLDIGCVHVVTGDGKGKTTSSFGLAGRAVGQGLKVKMIQFTKGPKMIGDKSYYGEVNLANKYLPKDLFSIEQYGSNKILLKNKLTEKDLQEAKKGWERAKSVILNGESDVVILDELNICMDFNMLKIDEVLDVLKNKPKNVEVVITGRYAPQELKDFADYVTELKAIKHPFDKGIEARRGIDYLL